MKALKKDLQAVVKNLRTLALMTEKIEKRLDKLAGMQSARKPKKRLAIKPRAARKRVIQKRAARRPAQGTAMSIIYNLIRGSIRGINTPQLKKKTGFDQKKIWNVINRLKTQRKIKSAEKGIYVKI